MVEPGGERRSSTKESNLQGMASAQNKSSLHARYAEVRKSAVLTVKNSKIQSCENFGHKLDSNHWQANEVLRFLIRLYLKKKTSPAII